MNQEEKRDIKKRFDSVVEVREERKKTSELFEGNLPNYLHDYFDEQELKLIKNEYYGELRKEKYSRSYDERREYKQSEERDFWDEYDTELVKKPKTVRNEFEAVYEEPPRAEERVEEERELTPEERKALIKLCSNDLYLFAIRYFPHYLKLPSSKLHKYLYNTLTREINKKNKRQGLKLAVAAPRSNSKCLKYDTKIQLYDGGLKSIKDINIGDTVVSIDDNLKLSKDKIINKVFSGKKLVRDFILKSGRKISATDDHRLFNIHGEVRCDNIKIGDKLATPRRISCYINKNSMGNDEAVFIANMLAEGCLAKQKKCKKKDRYSFKCSYTNFDNEVVEDFRGACNNLGFHLKESKNRKGTYSVKNAYTYIREIGIDCKLSTEKLIPEEIFKQNSKFLKLFISRFFATDGWISKDQLCAGITLANEELINQLFTILLRLGLLPHINYRPNDKSGAWCVSIYGKRDLNILKTIGVLHKQDKLESLILKTKKNKYHSNCDTIDNSWKIYLKKYTPHFLRKEHNIRIDCNKYNITRPKLKRIAYIDDNKFLENLSESDIYWDEVVEISDYYETDTYDIETEKYHNFIANNIVSHNSSIISAILPIWCICYNKKHFIIMLSDTAGQSEDFLSDIKLELESNAKLIQDFPNVCGKGSIWRADRILTNNSIRVIALGTGSKIRGRKFGRYRPDLLIGDDLESSEMVRSKSSREYIRYTWFDKDVAFAGGEEGYITDIIIAGTILGKDALLNAIINSDDYPEWQSIRFQAVEEESISSLWNEWWEIYKNRFDINRLETARQFFEANKDKMLEGTKVLWPEGDPYYNLMIWKYSKPSAFAAEKQNNPHDPMKILVQQEQIHWESFATNKDIISILKTGFYFGALDPSLGKKHTEGDYSCILTLCRDPKSGYIFVVDIDLKRRSVEQQIDDILDKHKKYRYKLFAVETNAFQYVVADALRKRSRETSIYVPIKEINNYLDKKMRFEGVVPFIIDGTIVFDVIKYRNNQMYNMGMEQIWTFTGEDDSGDDACVLPDTLITTDNGCKEIKDICVGDRVLTHRGRFRRVTKVYRRDYNGAMYNIKGVGTLRLNITDNHPIFVNTFDLKYYNKKRRTYKTISNNDFDFISPDKINESLHLVNTPIINNNVGKILKIDMSKFFDKYVEKDGKLYGTYKYSKKVNNKSNPIPRFINIDEKFAFIIGYYLAEGSQNNSHSFEFAGHKLEKNVVSFLEEWFKSVGIDKSYYMENGNGRRLTFNSRPFQRFFKEFNSSTDRHIPEFWYRLKEDETKALLFGYLFGDGNFTMESCRCNTISPSIAFQIYYLLAKIGCRSKISFVRRKGRYKGLGVDEFMKNDQYYVELDRTNTAKFFKDASNFIKEIFKDKSVKLVTLDKNIRTSIYKTTNNRDRYLSRKIREYNKYTYSGVVYNLEVEKENSYVANGIAVHNCDSLEMSFRIAQKGRFKLLTSQNR